MAWARPPRLPPRGHAADEDAGVARQVAHAHPVAQQRAAGERAGGIDGDDADGVVVLPVAARQRVDQGRLAGARRAGDADHVGAAGVRIERRQHCRRIGSAVFHQGDGAGQCAAVAREQCVDEVHC